MKSKHIDVFNTLLTPHVSEKSSSGQGEKYVFKVAKNATKSEIKKSVEELFNVKVGKVNTLNAKGKVKRFGRYSGKKSDWKKAYLTLVEGQIEIFDGE